MTSSLTPTVEEKKPTDQNSFRQYIFLIQGKRWRISRLVLALIFPTMADTAYFGGITITKWIWSTWMLNVSIKPWQRTTLVRAWVNAILTGSLRACSPQYK